MVHVLSELSGPSRAPPWALPYWLEKTGVGVKFWEKAPGLKILNFLPGTLVL